MSVLDLIAIGLIALAAFSGFRRGLVTGVFSLGGLLVGFYLGARVVPTFVSGDLSRWLPVVGLTGAMVFGAIGQTLGAKFGHSLRQALAVLGPLRLFDNVAGGFLGAAIGLALCWAIGAVFLYFPRPDGAADVCAGLQHPLDAERGAAADAADRRPRADRPVRRPRRPGGGRRRARPGRARVGGVNRAALSVVRVIGDACGLGVEGSGWVAAQGARRHERPRRRRRHGAADRPQRRPACSTATVVSFDRTNDIAVLRVADLDAKPLPLADAVEGTPAGMLGYPGNGPYHETAVRVGRVVRSSAATRTATSRPAAR